MDCGIAADIFRQLQQRNINIRSCDVFIVATAMVNSLPVATLNRKHFEQIDGLKLSLIHSIHSINMNPPNPTCHGFVDLGDTQLDIDRTHRCGFPEVVYGEGKSAETILKIFHSLLEHDQDAFATRVDAEKATVLLEAFRNDPEREVRHSELGRTFRVYRKGTDKKRTGKIAVVTAGTTDAPVAEEAFETALWTGAEAVLIQDIGVAGPHRLRAKLPRFQDADAVIVVAGMEGALPSVVGGYVACPVIAVPTSVGYGASFHGLAALLGMLNSCASNVTVVNIDAGFKAGYVAGLIARNRNRNHI